MLSRPIRALGHVGAVVALSGIAVVATGTAGSAAGSAKPDSYGGDATAASMDFRVDKEPFPFPVSDPLHFWVPYSSTSTDSSGGSSGIAASIYEPTIIGLPDLLCEFNPTFCKDVVSKIPPYPEQAHAQYPAHPDAKATLSQKPFPGTGPFEVTPNSVTAHADPNRVEATTITGQSGVTGVVTMQSATTHSLQKFVGGTLELTTESVLKGIDIGGKLHIDTITSTATAKIDGSKVGASSAGTTVSGASVAGKAVSIDSTGIHVVGHGDNALVVKTVNNALKSLVKQGITVRSLRDTKSARPTKVAAETGGVLVTYAHDVSGPAPPVVGGRANGTYTLSAALGGAGVTAFANPATPLPSLPTLTLPSTTPAGTLGGHGGGGAGAAAPPPASSTGTTSDNGSPPAVAAPTPAPRARLAAADLTWKKIRILALVLLAYPFLVLVSRPLRAPARYPGTR